MNCEQATRAISRSVDHRLPIHLRVGLGVHILFCSLCRRFRRQLFHLDRACREGIGGDVPLPEGRLSAEARQRIETALDQPLPPQ
jgi:hypothetical protein